MVSDSVSKKFGIEKSIGFGIENIWYRKKYRIRYRKNLVSEESFGLGFVQILGIVTHCEEVTLHPAKAGEQWGGKTMVALLDSDATNQLQMHNVEAQNATK